MNVNFSGTSLGRARLSAVDVFLQSTRARTLLGIPRAGLKGILAGLMGIDTFYAEESADVISPVSFSQATLTIRPGHHDGVDEFRPVGVQGQVNLACLRSFICTVKVECFLQATSYADDYLETLRTRLRFDSSRQALHTFNIALQTFEDIQKLPTSYDQRVISAASLDIHFGFAFTDLMLPAVPGGAGWVDTVQTQGVFLQP